jgi:predicted DNA binding CopG/RHH family protein
MIIESKKTHLQHSVTEEQWQEIKDKGLSKNFKVISNAKEYAEKKESLPPPEVREFITQQKKETNKRKTKKQNNDS